MHTDALNLTPEVQQAYQHFYDLDYDGAMQRFQKIQQEHPDDPISTDYVLNTTVFRELYRLDLLDTTLYVHDGFLSGKHPVVEDMHVRAQVDAQTAHAIRVADVLLAKNPQDVDALFARGYAQSLRATYVAMIEKSYVSALRLALAARKDHDEVLKLDPKYVDAKLVVGVHEYVVGSLPLPLKLMAGLIGISGSKTKGLAYLSFDGQYGIITATSANTALALFLRREAQYPQAIVVVQKLVAQYPRDFLFRLEYANLLKDSGQGPPSIASYRALLQQANTPGYFPNPHLEMAWYGLGEALRGQRDYVAAADAYQQASIQPTISPLLQRRSQLAAGEMYDLLHQRVKAQQQYAAVIASGVESTEMDRARRFQHSPYIGR
ncbi:MAG TPA: tetratricopeptide repeat protein [Acidobacteriaceae bacterium]|jgi:tetratricopeptide (TPR) repeat protein|nr:tetratricopeptide repeat protein [Acidobacteriaceae bacterium]